MIIARDSDLLQETVSDLAKLKGGSEVRPYSSPACTPPP